jgi:hypothetical protein
MSATELTVVSPPGLSIVDVIVTTPDGLRRPHGDEGSGPESLRRIRIRADERPVNRTIGRRIRIFGSATSVRLGSGSARLTVSAGRGGERVLRVRPHPKCDREGCMANIEEARRAPEDVRLALVMNGGVSLAIWIGGVTHEIDRLRRAGYAALRELDGATGVGEWKELTEALDVAASVDSSRARVPGESTAPYSPRRSRDEPPPFTAEHLAGARRLERKLALTTTGPRPRHSSTGPGSWARSKTVCERACRDPAAR